MCNNSRLLRVCALVGVAFVAGCDGLTLPDDTASGASTFLGLVVSDFSGTNAISVQNGAVSSESAPASWPQDLLADAPDDAVIIVSGTELSVTFADESVLLNSSTEPTEHHARVTFRFGAAGTNPCASEVFVGPFDVVIIDGEAALDTDSLPFTGDVRSIVTAGGFEVCAQADADFDGSVSVGKVKVEFGALKQGEGKVEVCHVPPDDPDAQHTITIGESAVEAHMDHGDLLGACAANGEPPDDPTPLDTDGDSVADEADSCANTLSGEPVDSSGCSCAQKDGDGDGVNDCDDACPDSTDSIVGADGCGLDADGDGVNDTADTCADTPSGELADSSGCSCSQLDADADGVNDCNDFCPGTVEGTAVDASGCELVGADAGPDVTIDEVGCVTLQGSAVGGTQPYIYSWSAPNWEGSKEQNPSVVPAATTTYTLTVTDSSFPPVTTSDTVTVTLSPRENLQYTIVDLGSLSKNGSFPSALNDAGQVVGFYFNDAFEKRAFLYGAGTMTDLGTLGGRESTAVDLNNAGQIVGQATTVDGEWHAFLWDAVNGMQDLGTLGGKNSIGNAINESGQIVGSSDSGTTTQAFTFDGVLSDSGTLDSFFSESYDVNDQGQIVGMILSSGNPQAFVIEDEILTELDLRLLAASRAWVINNSGMIGGHSWDTSDYVSFLHVCGTTITLGNLDGFGQTSVWGINDAGQMVGSVSSSTAADFNAFIYTAGQLHNLNDLLPDGTSWETLTVAFGVNASGQITGYGRIDGQFRGYLLTPAP